MTDFLRDDDGRVVYIRGYGAVYNALSDGEPAELVRPGAFDRVILHPSPTSSCQFHHLGSDFDVGCVARDTFKIWSDGFGLAFEAGPFDACTKNLSFLRLIANGQIRGASRLARPASVDHEYIGGQRVLVIESFETLDHIAPVADPAYSETGVWLSNENYYDLSPHLRALSEHWSANKPRRDTARALREMASRVATRKPATINARDTIHRHRAGAGKPFRMAARGSVGEIFIFDDIGDSFDGITAKSFAADLKALGAVRTLNIFINSPGGSVFDGVAIFNILKRHKARKVVFIDGIAASIASVIAMAGDEINIAANGFVMIHKPWAITGGTDSEHHKTADQLAKIGDSILNIYAQRTGTPENVIAEMMAAETWMNAQEALKHGFADQITKEVAIAAHFDLSKFAKLPAELRRAIRRAA